MNARFGATLGEVAHAVGGELKGDAGLRVADVTHDSRQVREGWLFAAVRGANVDAVRFVPEARARGAVGVLSEAERPADFDCAWVRVTDARRAMAFAAAEVHGHPSRELKLVGITGTNGKTTTAYLVASMVEGAGGNVALLSTVEYRCAGERTPARHTTPEATDVQRFLRRAVEAGCGAAVMESSSQALDLRRCDALSYCVAVFSNLTRDHLDYHGTMENYYLSKRRLFDGSTGERPRVAVVNLDDPYGARLYGELKREGQSAVSYAIEAAANVRALNVRYDSGGMSFTLSAPAGEAKISTPLLGRSHVYNLLAASAACLELGLGLDEMARAASKCAGAPGRFERVEHAGDFAVIVDYAHTDDALSNVLRTARETAGGRVITVFGCGGDRDRTKRAPMGEAAARLSDVVIITSDNPRTEDPEAILRDVEEGVRAVGASYRKITDRRAAIRQAISEARAGDVVMIAGKGHEDYQIVGTEKFHFDDREVAREALAERGTLPANE